ncbi:hypothetical protein LXL04_005948 [Taraxacum kok-saghyz]
MTSSSLSVAETIWTEIQSTRSVTDDQLAILHTLLYKNLETATRIVNQRGVKKICGEPSGRSIFQITGESRKKEEYLCFPNTMPTTFERNLNLCFSKIKRSQSPSLTPPPPPHRHNNHRHRRCHSEPVIQNPKSNLIKNFNTLNDIPHASDSDDSSITTTAPDFSTAIVSNRFFFSSPAAPITYSI